MATENFIPQGIEEGVLWLQNFAVKLPLYSTFYYIQPVEVADIQASSLYYSYVVTYHKQFDDHKINLTSFRDELRFSRDNFGVTKLLPGLPTVDPPPPVVPLGVFQRAAAIAQRIKKKKGFLLSDGYDLGIIAGQGFFDPQTGQPTFSIRLVDGGHPEIKWKKGKLDGVEIHVKRRPEDEFTFLDYDQFPNFTDMHPLPAAGRAENWSYKLIYRYKDKQVGAWSAILSITVTGG